MAEKRDKKDKDKKSEKDEGFLKTLMKRELFPLLLENLKGVIKSTVGAFQESVERIIRYALRKAYAFLFVFIGIIFLLVGLALLLESTVLPRGAGFLILGFVLLLGGLLVNLLAKR